MAKMHGIASVEFVKESNPNAPSLNSDKKGTPQDEILRCPALNHRYVMPHIELKLGVYLEPLS